MYLWQYSVWLRQHVLGYTRFLCEGKQLLNLECVTHRRWVRGVERERKPECRLKYRQYKSTSEGNTSAILRRKSISAFLFSAQKRHGCNNSTPLRVEVRLCLWQWTWNTYFPQQSEAFLHLIATNLTWGKGGLCVSRFVCDSCGGTEQFTLQWLLVLTLSAKLHSAALNPAISGEGVS